MPCENCGYISDADLRFCGKCGNELSEAPPEASADTPQNEPSKPHAPNPFNNTPPQPEHFHSPQYYFGHPPYIHPYATVNINPGSFAERVHGFGRSKEFLAGILLMTIGHGIGLMLGFSFLALVMFAIPLATLVGLWMIYAASQSPKLPEKTLSALSIFKVVTIIGLVAVCLLMGLGILLALIAVLVVVGTGGGGTNAAYALAFVIGFIVAVALFVLYVILYYVSLLRTLGGIRKNILENSFTPLRGVMPFSVIAIIQAVFGLLVSVLTFIGMPFLAVFVDEIAREFPEFTEAAEILYYGAQTPTPLMLGSVGAGILASVGLVLCVVVLIRLHKSLKPDSNDVYEWNNQQMD